MSFPESPYHVLRRLLSICYNSPLETSSFYASLLHDLFAEDLQKGVALDVCCLDSSDGSTDAGYSVTSGKEGTRGKGKSTASRSTRTESSSDPEPSTSTAAHHDQRIPPHQPLIIKKLDVHPHLAIHLRAWIHIGAKEYYSAIHLTRDRAYSSSSSNPSSSRRKDDRRDSDASHPADHQMHLILPFDGAREKVQQNHGSCLECAMILAEACQALGRYEEGRRLLKSVHESTATVNRDSNLSITLVKPASFPTPSALTLARLSTLANYERMTKSSAGPPGVDTEKEMEERQPDAIRYYEVAMRDDPWLWEAWRGMCDFGGEQSFAPFSHENLNLPLLPFPSDLLPDSAHLHTRKVPPHSSQQPSNTRSPSTIPSSPPMTETTSSNSFTTTTTGSSGTGVRRMSPLPSTSPARKSSILSGRAAAPTTTTAGAGVGSSGRTMPSLAVAGNWATPVGTMNMDNNAVQPPAQYQYMQEKRAARVAPPVLSKARGYGRLSPSIDDMSFPDLTFSHSDSVLPSTLFSTGFPGGGEYNRPSASASHPLELPSIASRLFPTARPVGTPPQAQQPRRAYESGIGKPPAMKRARNAQLFSDAVEVGRVAEFESGTTTAAGRRAGGKAIKPRNATGRNASGFALAERYEELENGKHLRRSTRIKDTHASDVNVTPELFHKTPATRSHSGREESRETDHLASAAADAFEQYQQRTADLWLLRIVQRCAAAYHESSLYNCRRAIQILNTLPVQLKRGAWATALYAKCYYELADYRNANTSFEHLRRMEPYRLESMEWYSTVLWHLEDRTGLSVLAQQLMAISREAAEPWMAAGNGFALQGDHEEALRCFKRASAVQPDKAYTYTLAAYEALEMDEYDRAIAHYQLGIRADVRHYHAWFGLGRVYQKMGKARYAEYHFRRALEINPSNVVLYCCVGTIVEKRGDLAKALEVYEKALEISPDNKMARFRKVRVMIGLKQYKKALPLLEDLSKTCSTEASIMFLLGKLYRLLGDRTKAMRAFTYARDLHPKLASAITSVMETGEIDPGDEEAAAVIREGL